MPCAFLTRRGTGYLQFVKAIFSVDRIERTELTKVIECHEIKAEVITSANQRRGNYLKEPI